MHQAEHLAEAVGAHGGEGEAWQDVHAPQVVGRQSALLAEEAHDVAPAQSVAFPLTYIYSGPLGPGDGQGRVGQGECQDFLRDVGGQRLVRAEQEVGRARGRPAGGASVAVGEGVGLRRQVVVDDGAHAFYVQSAGGEVGADERRGRAVAEAVEGALALVLLHPAVEGGAGEPPVAQEAGDALDALAVVDEDERGAGARHTEQPQQGFELVPLRGLHPAQLQPPVVRARAEEVQAEGGGGAGAQREEVGDFPGIRGGEEHAAAYTLQGGGEFLQLVAEAQLEAFVEFVDDERADGGGAEVLFPQVVTEASGRGDDEGGPDLAQASVLLHRGPPAVQAEGGGGGAERAVDLGGLLRQFARGGDDDGLHLRAVGVQLRGQGQQVGQRLARAGGREEDQVAAVRPGAAGGFLHGGERVEAEARQGLLNVHI